MAARNIDWKATLFRILDCFGDMEGVWYEETWAEFGVTAEAREIVEAEYQKYSEEKYASKKR